MADRKKMLNGIREIEWLGVNADFLIDLNVEHEELENRIPVSGEIANAILTKERIASDPE